MELIADYFGIMLAIAMDPILLIFVLFSFIPRRKSQKIITVGIIGITLGILTVWVAGQVGGSANLTVGSIPVVILTIVAAYIDFGLLALLYWPVRVLRNKYFHSNNIES